MPQEVAVRDPFVVSAPEIQAPREIVIPSTQALFYATFFGQFSITRKRQRLAIGNSRLVAELCQYLLAHVGALIPREVLIELLWPDIDPARGVHRLHAIISDLRRVLDAPGAARSVVLLEREGYAVAPGVLTTDVELFDDRYEHGQALLARNDQDAAAVALRAAARLYRGQYLTEQPYAEWAQHLRAHYDERQIRVLALLCDHSVRRGDLASMQDFAEAILEIDGFGERAHRQLMRAHYALGQRGAAIRQYRICAKQLKDELGVEPSMLTRALFEAICNDTSIPPEPPLRL